MARFRRIDAHFRKEDEEIYQFFLTLVKGWGDQSQVTRAAIECFRLFNGSLAQAQEAAHALAEMRRLFGPDWENEVKRFEKAVREV